MLALLDHPAPRVSADALLARSRRRRSHPGILLAAAALIAVAGVAVAAVPSATVHALVKRVFGRAAPPASQAAVEVASESAASVRGIAYVPHEHAKISFDSAQAAGNLRIRVVGASSLRITERSAVRSAQFALSPDGVTVRNAASTASYELWFPAALDHAAVWIAGVRVFEKNGTSRSCLGSLETEGSCVIPMRRSVEAMPPTR